MHFLLSVESGIFSVETARTGDRSGKFARIIISRQPFLHTRPNELSICSHYEIELCRYFSSFSSWHTGYDVLCSRVYSVVVEWKKRPENSTQKFHFTQKKVAFLNFVYNSRSQRIYYVTVIYHILSQ